MPRSSPFIVTLSGSERVELEARARKYTSSYLDVIRAKIVLLAAHGLSNDVIAARLDTPRQIVSTWRKRFCEHRLLGLDGQPRGGRHVRFSPQPRRRRQGPGLWTSSPTGCAALAVVRARVVARSHHAGAGRGDQRDDDLAVAERHARVFGRCEARIGIAPFDCLVADVMNREPYRSAARVFWVLDNGSAHRGARAVERLPAAWPTLIPVGTPIHASWLNQIEIYFSIVQRKVLTPNEFDNLEAVAERLLPFETRYEQMARPFEWKFTRPDLVNVLARYSEVHEAAA